MKIIWTEYMLYRIGLRGFDRARIENILTYSSERYFDNETRRSVVVGKHNNLWVLVPYEMDGDSIVPITVHAITRQQVNMRVNLGRLVHE
ncbi:hypothetical protein GC175_22425 [bacterium]|nr:hypothetical protein [bacterium]